jgi:chemotaxis protein methyltransferase CheR
MTDIRALTSAIKAAYGFDFTEYALSSFKRRLLRALEIYKLDNLRILTNKLLNDKDLYEDFLKEITVNTTEMFRDPLVWKHIKDNLIPHLQKLDKIKIWHTACSSGEEVFTMSILLKEAGLFDKADILATDINQDVINTAKMGSYPTRNMILNCSNYLTAGGIKKLEDYYTVDGYKVFMDLELLKNVVFKKHDLVLGKMNEHFDLIICRNVLIYFNLPLQDDIINGFNDRLTSNGYLVIGANESIAWCSSASKYNTFAFKEKIYQKK